MAYISEKRKISDFIEKHILPLIIRNDYSYYDVLELIVKQTKASKRSAKEVLDGFIETKEIKEMRILTVPDEKLDTALSLKFEEEKEKIEKDNEIKKDLELLKNDKGK